MMNKLYRLNVIVLTARNNMTIPYGKFSKKGLAYFTLNAISLLPKIDNIHFIAKQLNASIIAISESKLDSFILNSEVDIKGYDTIRMDYSKRRGRVDIKKSFCYIHKSSFFLNIECIIMDIILPKSKPVLVCLL